MKREERIYRNSETSEKSLERGFVRKMKEIGLMVVKNQDPMMCGMPDRLVILPGGKVVWIEFKSRGKRPTELQNHQMERLRVMGHAVIVVSDKESYDMAEAFINGCISEV